VHQNGGTLASTFNNFRTYQTQKKRLNQIRANQKLKTYDSLRAHTIEGSDAADFTDS